MVGIAPKCEVNDRELEQNALPLLFGGKSYSSTTLFQLENKVKTITHRKAEKAGPLLLGVMFISAPVILWGEPLVLLH